MCVINLIGSKLPDNWWVVLFVYKRIILALKRVEFVSDRMSYTILRGVERPCHSSSG
jgi:hypothetical protein